MKYTVELFPLDRSLESSASNSFKIEAESVSLNVQDNGQEDSAPLAEYSFLNSDDIAVASVPFNNVRYITSTP